MQSPISPNYEVAKAAVGNLKRTAAPAPKQLDSELNSSDLLTPPPTNSSSPLNNKEILLPNNFKYYTKHLNKNQFNTILINCTVNLMKILYKDHQREESVIDEDELKFFIVEILKRSKTSIQSLQLTCFYLVKLIKLDIEDLKSDSLFKDAKKLFLGLVIISSKFNQDYNYSFKSWLKICGVKEGEVSSSTFNLKILKSIEFKCLTLLDYDIYLNDLKYENWCNILIIFGYDFIKFQFVKIVQDQENNEIFWESNHSKLCKKLNKWSNFFTNNFKLNNLNLIKINFNNYYLNQLGTKILIKSEPKSASSSKIPSLFVNSNYTECSPISRKRCIENDYSFTFNSKKLKA